MESTNLRLPTPDNDPLVALLPPAPPLADDGFSLRVATALPPPARVTRDWPRWILCIAGAFAGVVVTWPESASLPDWSADLHKLAGAFTELVILFTNPMLAFALLVTALSFLFVFAKRPGYRKYS